MWMQSGQRRAVWENTALILRMSRSIPSSIGGLVVKLAVANRGLQDLS